MVHPQQQLQLQLWQAMACDVRDIQLQTHSVLYSPIMTSIPIVLRETERGLVSMLHWCEAAQSWGKMVTSHHTPVLTRRRAWHLHTSPDGCRDSESLQRQCATVSTSETPVSVSMLPPASVDFAIIRTSSQLLVLIEVLKSRIVCFMMLQGLYHSQQGENKSTARREVLRLADAA